ncbi:Hypothetical_protein [Hexamita inflata]|uniref:Hypothetical_protein n=1 Tax=Hexamita inflata TaxID=28002 RepID=A0AA86NGI2_9EUKA|nr:Hypothetical protein HINF_LOCUS6335 [Hexamita inflata]
MNDSFDAAVFSMNSTSVIILLTKITSQMVTESGSLSGISSNSPSISLQNVSSSLQIQTKSNTNSICGSIAASLDNAQIRIMQSNISGLILAAMKNGVLVGIGNNVSFVNIDSNILVSGSDPDFNADKSSCTGICGQNSVLRVKPLQAVTQGNFNGYISSYIFWYSTDFDNSQINFETGTFNGNFSVFQIVGNIRNLQISGTYSVLGDMNSYANIFGSNITSLTLSQIMISVSISTQSTQCKINILTNALSSQLILNSLVVSGTYQISQGQFSLINILGRPSYVPNRISQITNYQFTGQVFTQTMSSLIVIILKNMDLNVNNSKFIVSPTFNIAMTAGLLISKINQVLGSIGDMIFDNINIQKYLSDNDVTIVNGTLFNQAICTSIKLSNININYQTKNNTNDLYVHTLLGTFVSPNVEIINCVIKHYIRASFLQRFGLLSINSQQNSCLITINNVFYQMNAMSSGAVKDFGLIGGSIMFQNYSNNKVIINNTKIQAQITITPQSENQLNIHYLGLILGYSIMTVIVENTKIYDSTIDTSTCNQIGMIGGYIDGLTQFSNIVLLNCNLSAFSKTGLFANIIGVSNVSNINISSFTQTTQNQHLQSAIFCGNASNANITINQVQFKHSNYTGGQVGASSGIIFGSFISSNATINNCNFICKVNIQKYSVVNDFVSGAVNSFIDFNNTVVHTSNNCFAYQEVCKDSWLVGNVVSKRYQ